MSNSSERDDSSVNRSANVIYLVNERRRAALAEIDNARFSWFHVKVYLVAGTGFFTDAYDTFVINLGSILLGNVYGKVPYPNQPDHHMLSAHQELGLKVATPIGTLFGQLLFGWLADLLGRKTMYGVELIIIIVSTLGQALCSNGHAINIIGTLIAWRFLMGLGIGGDYPLSAVISSEFSSTRIRGRLMTAVFASQGWGNFVAALVAFIIVVAYRDSISNDDPTQLELQVEHIDIMWRILIGLGCVPGIIALYFRLTIPETPRFTMDIERNVLQASTDIENVLTKGQSSIDPDAIIQRVNVPKATWADFRRYFGQWKNGKVLLGTAYSWFALDIAFYGLGLNSSIILEAIRPPAEGTQNMYYNDLYNVCTGNLILSAAGLIPGYYFTFLFIDSWGRKPIQLMGFSALTILFIVMGFGYDRFKSTPAATKGFVVLYCFANFFTNFGPNSTTFVIPGEIFPTRYRSTGYGISAASGKLGAVIAQVVFFKLKDIGGPNNFLGHILEILALFMLTGILSTLLLFETKGQTLEELSNEDQERFVEGFMGKVEVEDGIIMSTL